jgi:hypothetical protein
MSPAADEAGRSSVEGMRKSFDDASAEEAGLVVGSGAHPTERFLAGLGC